MKNSADHRSPGTKLTAWLTAAARESGPVRSAHFDELGIEGLSHPSAAEVPGLWLDLLDSAVAVVEAEQVRDTTVGVIAALKLRETVPSRADWERGWDFLASSWNEIEPPSLYVLRSGVLREWDLDAEEHRFPLRGVPEVDHAFVRYWRDAEEIAADEEYSGAVYLLRELGVERSTSS